MFLQEAAAGKYQSRQYQQHVPPPTPQIHLSASQKMVNFSRALPSIIGGKRTTALEREAREALCEACEFGGQSCSLCGCRLQLKQKLAKQSCPILKWDGDRERFRQNEKPKTIASAVTTCPREQPTLTESLNSIRAAGFDPRVIEDEQRHGAWNTFRRGLAQIIASSPHADAYLMFQDDVRVSASTKGYLLSMLWPDNAGVCSLYCSGMYRPSIEQGWEQHASETYGALALCLTPLFARVLLSETEPRRKGEAVVDLKVGRLCRKAGFSYWIHVPSLVQHTGHTSTISDLPIMRTRRAAHFVEDAATLRGGSHRQENT